MSTLQAFETSLAKARVLVGLGDVEGLYALIKQMEQEGQDEYAVSMISQLIEPALRTRSKNSAGV